MEMCIGTTVHVLFESELVRGSLKSLRNLQVCSLAIGADCIENEYHILFNCGCFEEKRRTLTHNILAKVGVKMDSMDTPTQKIKFLMEIYIFSNSLVFLKLVRTDERMSR